MTGPGTPAGQPHERQTVDQVRSLGESVSNWGRWGDGDELGTLNHITPEDRTRAARLVTQGRVVSMALPFDSNGPQAGGFNRFNPIHLMIRDGADAVAGTMVRDFYGGNEGHVRGTDDIIIMPLQCGTQWDALSHVVFENRIWNGYPATDVTSAGARRNDVTVAADQMVGRGVLLDVARYVGVDFLPDGFSIDGDLLDACAKAEGVTVGRGDFVMVRTGQIEQRLRDGWGSYAGGDAPGLGVGAVPWVADHELAGVCTDTWGMEVRPNETHGVSQPLHIVFLVYMGLWVGEIFHLAELARDCAQDGRYEFLFCAQPLPFTGAVGSPVNPIAVK